jgi:hypothetical protein
MTMHFFEVEEAMKYGVESAILLTNIRFWLTKNKANQSHIHDGYYWTYNSAAAFVELFPYMPRRSISMYLKKLCDLGVLKSGNYNEIKYDRKHLLPSLKPQNKFAFSYFANYSTQN